MSPYNTETLYDAGNLSEKMLGYLPPHLQAIRELAKTVEIEGGPLAEAWQAADGVLREQFALAAGEYGIARWEELLGITPRAGVDLEGRRLAVVMRLGEQLPFTLRRLREILNAAVPGGQYELELLAQEFVLRIYLRLSVKNHLSAAAEILQRIVPANIDLLVELLYNDHALFAGRTHGELAAYTHEHLREEVFDNEGI